MAEMMDAKWAVLKVASMAEKMAASRVVARAAVMVGSSVV